MDRITHAKAMNALAVRRYYNENRAEILKTKKENYDAKRKKDIDAGIDRPGRGRPKLYDADSVVPKKAGRPRKLQGA
jgi:hypothetical protein